MADETQSGQPTAPAPTPVNQMTEFPQTQPVPAAPTPTPQPSGGRTLEDLSNELSELKRLNDELADKAARAEHEATYTRNLVETFRQGAQQQPEQPQGIPDITDDEFLQNPGKTVGKLFKSYVEQEKADREREKQMAYIERAKSLYETGSKAATEKLGRILSGIETEVKQQVQQGIISGAIDPDAATDPDLWAVTALAYRYKVKGERNFDKYFGETRTGMAPTYTETPTAGTPPQAGPVLSEAEKNMARILKVTDEQYAATKAKMAQER